MTAGPEERLLRQILDLAALTGWRAMHIENSTRVIRRRSGASVRVRNVNVQGVGFPDLVLVHAATGRIIFAELKSDRGSTTPEQKAWLADLSGVEARVTGLPYCPVIVRVLRPRDWPLIERQLTGQ